jgi:hypothetical protein
LFQTDAVGVKPEYNASWATLTDDAAAALHHRPGPDPRIGDAMKEPALKRLMQAIAPVIRDYVASQVQPLVERNLQVVERNRRLEDRIQQLEERALIFDTGVWRGGCTYERGVPFALAANRG